jgi:hypothetical protein
MFALSATHLGNTRLLFIDIGANKDKKKQKNLWQVPSVELLFVVPVDFVL